MNGRQKQVAYSVAVALCYTLYIAILVWPALARIGTHIPGNEGDAFVHLWNFEWIRDAILASRSPLFTQDIFYPNGAVLFNQNFAWLNIAFWLPLQALIGAAEAYTLLYVGTYLFNAIAAYVFFHELTHDRLAGFVGGLVVGGWQFLLTRYNQPNLILIGFVPLAMWAILKLTQAQNAKARRTFTWLVTIFIAAVWVTRFQLFIISVVLLVPWTLYCLWQMDRTNKRTFVSMLLAWSSASAIGLVSIAPALWHQFTRSHPVDLIRSSYLSFSTDLLIYLWPTQHHPFLGQLAQAFPQPWASTYFLGLLPLALAVVGSVYGRKLRWFWWLTGLLLLALALGERLTIFQVELLPLPFYWLRETLYAPLIRNPIRFNAVLCIPFAALAANGTVVLLQRFSAEKRPLIVLLIAIIITLEYRTPFATLPLATPAWYSELAAETGDFGIVGIPHSRPHSETYMQYQRTHGKGLTEGHVSRPPREAYAFIHSIPLLDHIADGNATFAAQKRPPYELINLSEQFDQLHDANIRYIVFHKAFMAADTVNAWRDWIAVAPHHEDDALLVYHTDLAANADLAAQISPSVGIVSSDTSDTILRSNQVTRLNIAWRVDGADQRPERLCLRLANATTCSELSLAASADKPQIVRSTHALKIPKTLKPGTYPVFASFQGSSFEPTGFVPLADIDVNGPARVFNAPPIGQPLGATFDDAVALLGYDLPDDDHDDALALTVYWQALVEAPRHAKYFVHVLDGDGALIAQADAAPRNWGYPMPEWAKDEIVADTIAIELAGPLPTGATLSIGLVDVETLERLAVVSAENTPYPNNAIPLQLAAPSD